ncbi:MAG: hypothetical protein H7836_13300, partial [Magnetococcus sp. YQC-3]
SRSFYTLTYTGFEGEELSYKFAGDIQITDLIANLRYFLLAASWQPETLDDYGITSDPIKVAEYALPEGPEVGYPDEVIEDILHADNKAEEPKYFRYEHGLYKNIGDRLEIY